MKKNNELQKKQILTLVKEGKLTPKQGHSLLKKLMSSSGEQSISEENTLRSEPDVLKETDLTDSQEEDIAIIGISCKYPGSDTVDEFWDNLIKGINSIEEIPQDRWEIEGFFDKDINVPFRSVSKWGGFINNVFNFDCAFFNISPREAELMDPQQRIFLEEAYKAMENAGYANLNDENNKCAVFVGYGDGDYKNILRNSEIAPDAHYFTGNSGSILASRISYFLNMKGPSISIDTACSSSLVAISLACKSILSGESEMALAGGVTVFTTPNVYLLSSRSGMLSPDGQCKAFDDSANGFVPSEGVGIIVLKKLKKAYADNDKIYAVIKGTKLNQDGKTNGITAPNSLSQKMLEEEAYKEFNINPETIGLIEAHGTGTVLGDPIEVHALSDAFKKYTDRNQFCAIGSVKTNIGHTQLAAGVAGIIKSVLCLSNRKLVPSLHFTTPNKHIDFENSPFFVNKEYKDWDIEKGSKRRAAVSAFGFSGTNAHVILEEFITKNEIHENKETAFYPIFVSAKKMTALEQKYKDLYKWLLNKRDTTNLKDLSYTLLVKRPDYNIKAGMIVNSVDDLLNVLEKIDNNGLKNVLEVSDVSENDGNMESDKIREANNFLRIASTKGIHKMEELSPLLNLYLKGGKLEWSQLFKNKKVHTLGLPVYPFNGSSYRIKPETDQHIDLNKPNKNQGNLIQEDENSYTVKFNSSDFFIKDHVVNTDIILPAVTYLETAIRIGRVHTLGKFNTLKNVVWLNPFYLNTGTDEMVLNFQKTDTSLSFIFQSIDSNNNTVTNCQGTLISNQLDSPAEINLEEFKLKSNQISDSDFHYSQFVKRGMHHGITMQGVQKSWTSEIETLAKIELHPLISNTLSDFVLHPSLLDSALQTIIGIKQGINNDADRLYLPFSLQELCIYKPLTSSCYAYARKNIESSNIQAGIINYDIIVADMNGAVLVQLKNLSMRSFQVKKSPIASSSEILTYIPKNIHEALRIDSSLLNKTILLFGQKDNNLLDEFSNQGENAIIVSEGESFCQLSDQSFEMNFENAADYQKLNSFVGLDEDKDFALVYYMNGTKEEEVKIVRLFNLIKSLLIGKIINKVHVLCVYNSQGSNIPPEIAAIEGFAKTIRHENSRIHIKLLHFAEDGESLSQTAMASIIKTEIRNTSEHAVCYKGLDRFVNKLIEIDLEASLNETLLSDKGVYLITGGSGGLALIIAKYLVEVFKAHIILLSRAPLDDFLAKKIEELEMKGGEITYLQTDVTNFDQLESSFKIIKDKYPIINGVIHTAGINDDSYIWNKEADCFLRVIAPKTKGTIYLDTLTAEMNLDFFILYSSVTSITGNPGQSDYTYANSFLDNFSMYRNVMVTNGSRKGQSLTINWPMWENGGMKVDKKMKELLANNAGIVPLSDQEGVDIFNKALISRKNQVVAYKGNKSKIERLIGNQLMMKQNTATKNQINKMQETDVLLKLQNKLKSYIIELMKVANDEISLSKDMSEYGFDSITFTEFGNRINAYFKTDLMPLAFFEFPTLGKFSKHLIDNYNQEILSIYDADEKDLKVALEFIEKEVENKTPLREKEIAQHDSTATANSVDPVAIIGMSATMPGSENIKEFWEHLINGDDLISEIPINRWDWKQYDGDPRKEDFKTDIRWGGFMNEIDIFDASFFNISPREAELMDPQQRLFLQTVWSTIEDAGYKPSDLSGTSTGLFVGVSTLDYAQLITENAVPIDGYTTTGRAHSILANRISYFLDLHGPSEPIDTACSSSLISIIRAVESIQSGNCEMALAGGVNVIASPELYIAFSKAGMLSKDGRCKPFDKNANGYARGEGSAAVLLKPLSKAISDGDHVYAVIKGTAINHGGRSNSLTAPNPTSQKELLKTAYKNAGINPSTVSYIETHGTGTSLGDPIEIESLKKAFEEMKKEWDHKDFENHYCALGSVKSNMGHLEAAAGIAGIVKTTLMLQHKLIPPTIHLKELNPYIKLEHSPFHIPTKSSVWGSHLGHPRRAGVSSFGYGGANAHIVLEEFIAKSKRKNNQEYFLIPVSAQEKDRLLEAIKNLLGYLVFQSTENKTIACEEKQLKENELSCLFADFCGIKSTDINVTKPIFSYIKSQEKINKLCLLLNQNYNLSSNPSLFFEYPNIASLADLLIQKAEVAIELPETNNSFLLQEIAYTLQTGREAMEYRTVFITSDLKDLISQLDNYVKIEKSTNNFFGYVANPKDCIGNYLENAEELYANQNLESIASSWILGYDMNWKRLYPQFLPQRIALPTYPFAKEKYWFPLTDKNKNKAKNKKGAPSLHPLIDENTSDIHGIRFSKIFYSDEFFIKDHSIGGSTILPGVAYLEMAMAAGIKTTNKTISLIKDVTWGNAITVEKNPVATAIQIVAKGDEEYEYTISGTVSDKNVVYSKGRFTNKLDTSIVAGRIEIEQLKNKYAHLMKGDELYERFRKMKFDYGPSFKVLSEVYAGENEALALIELPQHLQDSINDFNLPIPLMDGGLQTILAMNNKNVSEATETYIPFSLRRLEIIGRIPLKCYAYVVLTFEKNGIRKFNITLADETGTIVVRFIDFTARALPNQTINKVDNSQKSDLLGFGTIWKEKEIELKTQSASKVLVLSDDETIAKDLLQFLEIPAYLISFSDEFSITGDRIHMNIDSEVHYQKLLSVFSEDDSISIINLNKSNVALSERDTDEFLSALKHQNNSTLKSIFHFAKSSSTNFPKLNIKYILVNLTPDTYSCPEFSMMSAFGKSITVLNNRFNLQTLSIAIEENTPLKFLGLICAELNTIETKGGEEILYKNGKRHIRQIVESPLPQKKERSLIKENGVYLITGGAGKIGLKIAEDIVDQQKVKIVLSGRSAPSIDDKKRIESLQNKGSEIIFIPTDVAKKGDVEALITRIKQDYKALNGIFHAAGTLINSQIVDMDYDTFRQILLPKTEGTINLDESTKNESLDFFVLLSSLSSVLGDFGACNYAVANKFMDDFVFYRNSLVKLGKRKGKSVSFSLPMLEEGSMKLPDSVKETYYQNTGLTTLTTAEFMTIFNNSDEQASSHIIVAKGDSFKIKKVLNSSTSSHLTISENKKIEGNDQQHQLKEGENQIENLFAQSLIYLKELFSTTVKIPLEKINPETNFEKYGIDSMLIMNLNTVLNDEFGSIPQTLFFEYLDLKSLTEYFVENHSETLIKKFDLTNKKTPICSNEDIEVDSQIISNDNFDLNKAAEDFLKVQLSQATKIPKDKIDATAAFEKFGIDSVMILDLNKKLEEYFGSLPQTLFFEYNNLKELSLYFIENEKEALEKILKPIENIKTNNPDTQKATESFKETTPIYPNSTKPLDKITTATQGVYEENMDIAVIGLSGRYPMAENLEAFWENLAGGKDCIEEIPIERFDHSKYYDPEPYKMGKSISKWGGFINDIDKFDAGFFNVIPRVAKMIDPQERLFLETVHATVESAGYTPKQLVKIPDSSYKTNVGVYLGFMYDDYKMIEAEEALKGNNEAITGYWNASLANRISYQFNYNGPSIALDTACSSSLVAIHMACESIRKKECYYAIAGGVNLSIHPSKYVRLSLMGMSSGDGKCRSFGKGGSGYVPGEAVGATLLKPLKDAIADGDNILAVIKGSAVNHGGKTNGFSVPNPNAQAEVIDLAFKNAGLNPKTASYIEAHGTGTSLGDPIEIAGLSKIFKKYTSEKHFCMVGSVKSNVGHCEGGAGIAAFSKTILQMKFGQIAPSLHSSELNPMIDFNNSSFVINQELTEWKRPVFVEDSLEKEYPRIAGISSFGAGGVNAHIVLEEYTNTAGQLTEQAGNQLIVLSARTEERLQEYARQWRDSIEKNSGEFSLSQIAFVSQTGRDAMDCRMAIIAKDKEDLLLKLENFIAKKEHSDLFTGQLNDEKAIDTDVSQLKKKFDAGEYVYMAEEWVHGAAIDFITFYEDKKPNKIVLPGYPFARESYWIPILKTEFKLVDSGEIVVREVARIEELAIEESPKEEMLLRVEEISEKQISSNYSTQDQIALCIKDLKNMLAEVIQFPIDQLSETMEFSEYGIDSISIQQFIQKIIKNYISISETALFAYQTIKELAEYIVENHGEELLQKASFLSIDKEILTITNSAVVTITETVSISNLSNDFVHTVIDKSTTKEYTNLFLKETLSQIVEIPVENIQAKTEFSEFGIDSISITQFTKKVIKRFEMLSETALFAYQTIDELSDYLVESIPDEINKLLSVPTKLVFEDKKKDSAIVTEKSNSIESIQTSSKIEHTDIAIIGVSGKFPGANDLDEFYSNLLTKTASIKDISDERWSHKKYFDEDRNKKGKTYSKWGGFLNNVDKFDPLFFNISPEEAKVMDPQERLFIEAAWSVLEDAGYTKANIFPDNKDKQRNNIGVFVGVTTPSYNVIGLEQQFEGNDTFTGVSFASIANRVSYILNLTGPSMPIDTMCSSSLVAIHEACQKINTGECEMAIAGGVNLYLHPSRLVDLCRTKLLAADETNRSFTSGGEGFVPGEGVGAVFLKPLEKAIADKDHIYGVIKGSSVKHTGRTNAYFVPNPTGQENLIKEAIKRAGVDPLSINYIEAQAVGSELIDALELHGLQGAFSDFNKHDRKLVIGSLKPNIGHAEAASGMGQLIKVLLQFKHKMLLPTILNGALNPRFTFDKSVLSIQSEASKWEENTYTKNGEIINNPRRAGISSFGAGGTGAHLILEEYVNNKVVVEENNPQLILLSAKTRDSLNQYIRNLNAFLDKNPGINLSELSYTLQSGREQFSYRLAIIASSVEELKLNLHSADQGHLSSKVLRNEGELRIEGVINLEELSSAFNRHEYLEIVKVWLAGNEIDMSKFYLDMLPAKVSLPTYPFERRICWANTTTSLEGSGFIAKEFSKSVKESSASDSHENWNESDFSEIEELRDADLKGVHEGRYVINNYLGMYILNHLQEKGLFHNGSEENIDTIIEGLSLSKEQYYIADVFIELLESIGFAVMDHETIKLTELASTSDNKSMLKKVGTRDQFILRALPEFTNVLELFKNSFNYFQNEKKIKKQLEIPLEFRKLIQQSIAGESRLSFMIGMKLDEVILAKQKAYNFKHLQLIELGANSTFITRKIISSLTDKVATINYYGENETRVDKLRFESLKESCKAVEFKDLGTFTTHQKQESEYLITVIGTGFLDSLKADKYDELISTLSDYPGIIIFSEPVEKELFSLTLGWFDSKYTFIKGKEKEADKMNFIRKGAYNLLLDKGNWLQIYETGKKNNEKSRGVQEDIEDYVLTLFSNLLGLNKGEIGKNQLLEEFGMNSIYFAKAFSLLVEKFGQIINPSDLLNCTTINQVSILLSTSLSQSTDKDSQIDVQKDILEQDNISHTIKEKHNENAFKSKKNVNLISTSRGIDYEVVNMGKGEPILFLTALAFTSTIWDKQIAYFEKKHQIILPNLPAHGNSSYDGKAFTFEQIADDIAEILNKIKIEKIHVVGWCMAGNIAQLFAIRHPNKIKTLALLNTTPLDASMRGVGGDDLRNYSNNPLGTYDLEFQNIYQQGYFERAEEIQGFMEHINTSHCPVDANALMYYIDNLFRFDTRKLLGSISAPTLVVSGKYDITYPPDQVALLHNGVEKSKYYEFGNAGHMPFMNQATEFNTLLENFMKPAKSWKRLFSKEKIIQ